MPAHTDPHSEPTPSTPARAQVLDFSALRIPGVPQSTAVLSRSELDRYLAAARAADGDLPDPAA
jgi:hypothetical protein